MKMLIKIPNQCFLWGPAEVLMLLTEYDKILVLWDSIRRSSLDQQQRVQMYDKVYAFEYNDLAYMQETFGIKNMEYLPVGYDDGIIFRMIGSRKI